MPPPDYPRLPPSYRFDSAIAQLHSVTAAVRCPTSTAAIEPALRAACALTLAAHAGEERFAVGVVGGKVFEGELDRTAKDGNLTLLREAERTRDGTDASKVRLRVEYRKAGAGPGDEDQPTTPLHLVATGGDELDFRLTYDSTLVTELETTWFLSHVTTGFLSLLSSPGPAPLSLIALAPSSESAALSTLTTSPPPPEAYPSECTTLPSFFLHAATLYPDDPALHFSPGPDSVSPDLVLSFSKLLHISRYLAFHLLSSVPAPVRRNPSDYVVPLCVDKSPAMIVSMLAISLAGFGYLALEPSFPEGRKKTILNELRKEKMLAGAAIVQSADEEHQKWGSWKVESGDQPLLETVLDPSEVIGPLLDADLSALAKEWTIPQLENGDEWPQPKDDGIAYVIYTSGTTGVPKGITVEHRNVAAFLRNYRGVFGRARGERVLQFPSYSFDVSVMNIWDTFAHGSTLCITTPSSLFSDLAGAILRLGCTLVDLTPTISALLFEHPDAQCEEGETPSQAWKRAGFKIKQVNTGGEKVERAVREKWRERGVRVVIDYGPTETTVGVVSNQSLAPTPSAGLPIGRPTGLTRIHILSPTSLTPVPLGCIGEICVTGEQVTRGYVKQELNKGVFFELSEEECRLLGIKCEAIEERRLYRTGDLGRWLADGEGSIECLGRKDGQVKVNGLRIEIGEIEEHLSTKTNPALVRGIVDKFETSSTPPALVAFLELSSSFISTTSDSPPQQNGHTPSDPSSLVHPITSTPEFASLVSSLQKAVAEKLPHYMVPRYWLAVHRIPTQGMGKADRKMLRGLAQQYDFRGVRQRRLQAPQGGEKKNKEQTHDKYHAVARKAWARALKLDEADIGDTDGFTQIGGDSIRSMRVGSILRSEGWMIGFRQLGEARTLSECAKVLERCEADGQQASGITLPRAIYQPFSLIPSDTREPVLDELTSSSDFSLPRASISDVYPTAPSQDALLAPSFDSPQGHYYAQAVYALDSNLPLDKLDAGVKKLIERHEVLRTVFVLPEALGRTAQVVLAKEDEQVRRAAEIKRVGVEKDEDLDATVSNWLQRDREQHAFRWGQLALSFALFSTPSGVRKLAWSMHHAMSDGWTLELLTADLRALCHDLDLPDRPPFSSFVAWWLSESEPSSSSGEFWRSYLSGATPLHWPSQNPLDGEMLATTSATALHWTGDLTGLSQRNGITPAIASRLAISLALSYHAGSHDVTLGIVRSGRDVDVDRADEMIGPCVSVLPSRLRLDPSSSSSLLDLAEHETDSDRLARLHQRVTLSNLARICALPSRTDLFDILVTYQSLAELDDDEERLAPWPIRQPPERIAMPTNYTLSFEITPEKDDPDKLELACFFDGRIIEKSEVDGVLKTIAQVMDYLTTAPCTKVGELKLGDKAPPRSERPAPSNQVHASGEARSSADELELAPLVARLKKEWSAVLRLDEADLFSADDSFGSLGGDSISTMRLAVRLSKAGLAIPTQTLAKLPTLRQQAAWLRRNEKA
ncbi:hypothetical protein JCM1841_006935 [Sporobolomyces salmonicolor]